jgi:hypothetical protein
MISAEMSQRLATPSARRVFRPTEFLAPPGQGAYIKSRGAKFAKVQTSPFEDDLESSRSLMIPKLAESIGPVTILDPLAGAFTHLLAQFWIRG